MSDSQERSPDRSLSAEPVAGSPDTDSTPDLRCTVTIGDEANRNEQDTGYTLRDDLKLPEGHDFGKYNLLGEIGRGGMGVVYKARQSDLDRIVALKMILSSHLASPEQVARFYAEARAAARLNDPNIVRIHEVGEHQGQHYFTMEYIAGRSLAQLIRHGPIAIDTVARIVMIVARAVHTLHQHGMIHRDLKPSNILIDTTGHPFVSDFGLAKLLETDKVMSVSGTIVGTPGYMAPEQAASQEREVGPWSDIYSLGAILYESLTGQPPHSGDGPLETLVQVLEGEPIEPRRINPSIPKSLERICLKCLEKQPGDRYASALELADDLDHFLCDEPVEATRGGPWHRLRRWARREPALASRLGTMAVCGAIIQANRFIVGNAESASQRAIAVVVCWALASVLFQWAVRRDRWSDPGRYAWAAVDVVLFSLLVYVNQGMNTSLVSGYFLLVSASGLWFRERMVWLTTVLSVTAYALLAIGSELTDLGQQSPYRHVVFASALAASGFVVSYQVRRVRALSQYYEHRPLP